MSLGRILFCKIRKFHYLYQLQFNSQPNSHLFYFIVQNYRRTPNRLDARISFEAFPKVSRCFKTLLLMAVKNIQWPKDYPSTSGLKIRALASQELTWFCHNIVFFVCGCTDWEENLTNVKEKPFTLVRLVPSLQTSWCPFDWKINFSFQGALVSNILKCSSLKLRNGFNGAYI